MRHAVRFLRAALVLTLTLERKRSHHRLEAVRNCGIKKVNIPVKDLSDTLMVKIMANENQNDWHMDTSIMNQTIWAVQDFIRDEVIDGNNHNMIVSKKAATQIRGSGKVGHTVLVGFLGSAWRGRIETALELRKLEAG